MVNVVSFVHDVVLPRIVRTIQLLHELGQYLLQPEARYDLVVPTPALFVTLKYTETPI